MTPRKTNRAFVLADITMPATRTHIERQLSPYAEPLAELTAKQLAAVIRAAQAIYHEGRASCRAECLDGTPQDGLYWLGGKADGVAVSMLAGVPSLCDVS